MCIRDSLGLVYGGATVAAWYPITPSTSIPEAFQKYCEKFRVDPATGQNKFAIVQAEDELASIGMAIGAGWNGARSFTATSGPGVSRTVEGRAALADLWDALSLLNEQIANPTDENLARWLAARLREQGVPGLQQLGGADHAIERAAQLMAHVGQEAGLGLRRRLGARLRRLGQVGLVLQLLVHRQQGRAALADLVEHVVEGDADLTDLAKNADWFDPVTRAYRLQLQLPEWLGDPSKNGKIKLRVVYTPSSADGEARKLRDEFVVSRS